MGGRFQKADVVLTTYKVLREDERNNYTAIQSPLLHCEWWRIVLDESNGTFCDISAFKTRRKALSFARVVQQWRN